MVLHHRQKTLTVVKNARRSAALSSIRDGQKLKIMYSDLGNQ